MICKIFKYFTAALILFSFLGCSKAGNLNCGSSCGTTQESIDEFVRTGSTFANDFNVVLDAIDVQKLKDADGGDVYGFPAGLYMQPAAGDTSYDSLPPSERHKLYRIDYSRESPEGEFERYSLGSSLDIDVIKTELHVSSDYTLALIQQDIPIESTHVELWYRESEDGNFQLVRRVELRELWMWRKYILGEEI